MHEYLSKWVRYKSDLPLPKPGRKLQRSMYGIAVGIVDGMLRVNWGDGCELPYTLAQIHEIGFDIIGDRHEFSY